MTARPLLAVVLAAGKGTRMQSAKPKVLHAVAGRSMLGHVLATATAGSDTCRVAVVVGPDMDAVAAEARRHVPGAEIFVQAEQRGTADAVLSARSAIAAHDGPVIVLFGDTPLFRPETLAVVRRSLENDAVTVVGFEAADPTGYGRLLRDDNGHLLAIREHGEASEAERRIALCNGGVMGFRAEHMLGLLDRIGCNNAKREYYLTDAVALARTDGLAMGIVPCAESEVLGINSRDQLADAEAIWQSRRRHDVMRAGATLIAPETVWLSHDTAIGRDVVIEPNVFFGPGVVVEDGVMIKANSHIDGAHIRTGAIVGPFARLRPGADIGVDVHIGNFVEVKNARLEQGAKANHLAYIGDGRVGAGANIGAGTIFCNYDGFFKHHTDVGRGAFIGSNSSLVAPVKIGDGAFVGSGSVITKDVAADALAVERSTQVERPGWAAKFRAMMLRRKKERTSPG